MLHLLRRPGDLRLLLPLLAVAWGCGSAGSALTDPGDDPPPNDSTPQDPGVPGNPARDTVVGERWISDGSDGTANLDSPQFWLGPSGQAWVLVTAKDGDQLHVLDATDGSEVRRIGRSGTGAGEFDRPNGVGVWRDWVLVVERDNARVQVLSLPDFTPLGTFGEADLSLPYGIALASGSSPDETRLWITDNYDAAGDYSRRVHEYLLRDVGGAPEATHVRNFGGAQGPGGAGRLEVVETIWTDPEHDVLLVADEAAKVHRVFTLDGVYKGPVVADGLIKGDPEGTALYRCGDDGYWILTDQRPETSVFHVLDRVDFTPLASFWGPVTANTDGIGLTQAPVLGEGGAVFALHDDRAVSAFAWADVAEALGLQVCGA